MRAPLLAALLVLASLAGAATPAGANHLQSSGSKSLSFDHRGGNEWWVEVKLGGASASSVSRVEAMDTGGSWKPLTLRSWGNWAASFHVEPGHLVRFRATFPDGAVLASCDFTHPAGAEKCGTTPPPPPGGFDATFTGVKGNAWWVEAKVSANKALAGVDARANGGDWKPLSLRSWGAWAASFHVPEGSLVQLRARATDGSLDFSAGGWRWTAAAPYPAASTAFEARFENLKGNAHYAQVNVYANRDLKTVEMRVDEGAWQAMARKTWGDWSLERSIPDGSVVQFRAVALDGASVASLRHSWPSLQPVGQPVQWPREGSYLVYNVSSGGGSPAGDVYSWADAIVTLRYQGGRWEAECVGTAFHHNEYEYGEDVTLETPFAYKAPLEPPIARTDVKLGDTLDFPTLEPECVPSSETSRVVNQTEYATKKNGAPVKAPAWLLDWDHDCGCRGTTALWSLREGIVFDWWFGGRGAYSVGELLDTDAQIARGDAEPTPPPAPSWPREGSYARYQTDGQWRFDGIDVYLEAHVNVTMRYTGGRWVSTCVGHWDEWRPEGYARTPVDQDGTLTPPMGPLRVAPGADVVPEVLHECHATHVWTEVRGQYPEGTTRHGSPFTAKAWWSDEFDGEPDHDAWWNLGTGLTLRWEQTDEYGRQTGKLLDTDAPLT